jgi:hypothetical protein
LKAHSWKVFFESSDVFDIKLMEMINYEKIYLQGFPFRSIHSKHNHPSKNRVSLENKKHEEFSINKNEIFLIFFHFYFIHFSETIGNQF